MRRVWKLVGLAGIAGVAATGVLVVRAERRRAAYTPEQVRERLHARYAQAGPELRVPLASTPPSATTTELIQRMRLAWARGREQMQHLCKSFPLLGRIADGEHRPNDG